MKEGQVGVLVSKGYGAGWSTWNQPECALDQELVEAFESGKSEQEIMSIAKKNWPKNTYAGLMDCEVVWVYKGTRFRIDVFDGREIIEFDYSDDWQVAM